MAGFQVSDPFYSSNANPNPNPNLSLSKACQHNSRIGTDSPGVGSPTAPARSCRDVAYCREGLSLLDTRFSISPYQDQGLSCPSHLPYQMFGAQTACPNCL